MFNKIFAIFVSPVGGRDFFHAEGSVRPSFALKCAIVVYLIRQRRKCFRILNTKTCLWSRSFSPSRMCRRMLWRITRRCWNAGTDIVIGWCWLTDDGDDDDDDTDDVFSWWPLKWIMIYFWCKLLQLTCQRKLTEIMLNSFLVDSVWLSWVSNGAAVSREVRFICDMDEFSWNAYITWILIQLVSRSVWLGFFLVWVEFGRLF